MDKKNLRRNTILDIQNLKGAKPVVALTAYTAPIARLLDEHVDILLVGDSIGMVLYGMESTLPVSLDIMIAHGKAVVRSSKSALVAVDMPFGSYQGSTESAFDACVQVIKETGCQAVKIEGGAEMADTIAFLTQRGIPVMAHIALMPQHVNMMGGYRYQGRNSKERKKILDDATAVEKAGVFSVVLEGIEESLAREVTAKLSVPTIGIGASPKCDGQVLVIDDMLGLTENAPSFVKHYANLSTEISKAVAQYADDVRKGRFPTLMHCFTKK
jgi:3-methyl-2-oxobutanoate hydroxymethyltransferase